jgi:NhaP-type Na+/H+ or K+/H+ antiporter
MWPRATRRPSRLGLIVTFCLLIGLLVWRLALPASPLWLDLAVLAGVGALLLLARRALRNSESTRRKDASR